MRGIEGVDALWNG